jgi:hypothetical protein
MLELRLTCEHCHRSLPPNSLEACICGVDLVAYAQLVAIINALPPEQR